VAVVVNLAAVRRRCSSALSFSACRSDSTISSWPAFVRRAVTPVGANQNYGNFIFALKWLCIGFVIAGS
jgi:hypothetical protein